MVRIVTAEIPQLVHVDVRTRIPIQIWDAGKEESSEDRLQLELTDTDEIHLETAGLDAFVSATKLRRALDIAEQLGAIEDPAPVRDASEVQEDDECKCPKCSRTFKTFHGLEVHLARSHKRS